MQEIKFKEASCSLKFILPKISACKRKEEQNVPTAQPSTPKKPRLVFTDIQRRTLQVSHKH